MCLTVQFDSMTSYPEVPLPHYYFRTTCFAVLESLKGLFEFFSFDQAY